MNDICTGRFGRLEMMSPPITAGLEQRVAEVLVLWSHMEFQSIDLQVFILCALFCVACL